MLRSRLAAAARLSHNEDLHAGYYTWDELGGDVSWRLRPLRRTALRLAYGATWRR